MGAAILLVVLAAFAHAGWNFFAKRAGAGGAAFVWLNSACSALLYLPAAAFSLVISGVPALGAALLGVLVSASLHLCYFVVLQRGYASGDMSVVYPLARGTGPLLTVIIAVTLLGERPHPLGLAGAVLVIVGVFVIGFSDGLPRWSTNELAAVGFGLLTGSVIALYTVWDSRAVTALALSPLLFEWANDATRAALFMPYAVRRRDRVIGIWKAHRSEVLAVALLSPLAYTLALFAMRLAPVSLVAPARELSIVLAGLLAWRVLGEPQPGRRLTGAAVVLAGVALISVS